jgi:DNA-binding NarL/FixJ family response regulator
VRCCWLRATSRRLCRCCATPVGAGTNFGSAYDAAGTCVRLAEAYRAFGDAASADAELARAEAVYERLGARPPMRELPHGLTQREYEVLTLVADGRSNREIGAALFISDRTVARHLTNIYNKLGVTSRTQAARYAMTIR